MKKVFEIFSLSHYPQELKVIQMLDVIQIDFFK